MTDDRNTAYTDGVRLGMWLESTVRPTLAKWGKSADVRVCTLATVLSELIEAHVGDALDGALLGELYGLWVKHAVTLGEQDAAANTARRAAETGLE
jgi:hypothetical protein